MNIQQDIQLPSAGEPISQSWGKRVTDAVNSGRVGGGVGTMTESSKLGTYVSNKRRQSAGGGDTTVETTAAVLCRISGGTSATGYSVQLFPEGAGMPPDGTGTLYIVEIAAAGDLPVGAFVLGWPATTLTTGGNEDDV